MNCVYIYIYKNRGGDKFKYGDELVRDGEITSKWLLRRWFWFYDVYWVFELGFKMCRLVMFLNIIT